MSASKSSVSDGQACQWLGTQIIYGLEDPQILDEYEQFRADQIEWYTQITITIPGTLIAVDGPTFTICPSQNLMYFIPVNNGWSSVMVKNPYPYPINMTVAFTSSESASCTYTVDFTVAGNPIGGTSPPGHLLDLPYCQQLTMIVSSTDSDNGYVQTCWSWAGNVSDVFDDAYVTPSTAVTSNATSSNSGEITDTLISVVNTSLTQFQINLYQQSLLVLNGAEAQLQAQLGAALVITRLLPLANLTTNTISNVSTAAVQFLGQYSNEWSAASAQIQLGIIALVQQQASDTLTASSENNAITSALNGELSIIANASAEYTLINNEIDATLPAIQNLTGQEQVNALSAVAYYGAQLTIDVQKAQLAVDNVNFLPLPCATCAPLPVIDIPGITSPSGWGLIVSFAESVGDTVEDLVNAIINAIEDLLNPSCCFMSICGISLFCLLNDIINYFLIGLFVVVGIIGLVLVCYFTKLCKSVLPTKSSSSAGTRRRKAVETLKPARKEPSTAAERSVLVPPSGHMAFNEPAKPKRAKTQSRSATQSAHQTH